MAPQRPNYATAARQLRPSNAPLSRSSSSRPTSAFSQALGERRERRTGGGGGQGGIGGLFSDVSNLVTSLPSGIAGLAGQTAESLAGFPRLAVDVLQGDDFSSDYGTNLQEYFPVLEEFRRSGKDTASRLASPTQYLDAFDEGRFVSTLVEDVGNLAGVGSVAAKGLTAAGATTAGSRLASASRLGDQFGAAPAKVYTAGPKLAGRAVNRGVQRLTGQTLTDMARPAVERALLRPGPKAGVVRSAIAQRLDPEVRSAKRDLGDYGPQIATAQAAPLESMALRLRGADPNLKMAAAMSRTDFYDRIGRQAKDLPEAAFNTIIEDTYDGRFTPEAARIAIAAAEGKLDAPQAKMFEEARKAAAEAEATRTDNVFAREGETPEQFVRRTGFIEGPLNPEQRGNALMQRVLDGDKKLVRAKGARQRIVDRKIPEAQARALRLRSQADARRALDRPVAEAPSQGSLIRKGRQQGRTMQQLTASKKAVRRLQRELDQAIAALLEADTADTALLQRLAERVDQATDAYNAAIDRHNAEVAFGSDRNIGKARAELAAARKAAAAATRDIDRAAKRSGQTPRSISSMVDRAAARLDEAQRVVDSLERELDAQMAFNAPEANPSLRGTFSRGERTGRLEARARIAEADVRKLERVVATQSRNIAKRVAELTSATGEAVPKRFRQIAAESERANAALLRLAEETNDPALRAKLAQVADEIPKTLDEFNAAGIDPAHLIGGDVTPRTEASLRQQNNQMPRMGRNTSSRQAKALKVDYDMGAQAVQEAASARRLMGNVAALDFVDKRGVKAVDVLPDAEGLKGRALAEAMRAEGYTAFDPKGIFSALADEAVKADTVFLPKNLFDAMAYTLQTARMDPITAGFLQMNQKWKNVLLPISPTWYQGNIFGNALMAMVGAGMDPVTYTRLMVDGIRQLKADGHRLRDAIKEGEIASSAPRRLRTAGLTYAESGALDPSTMARKRGRTRVGRGYQRFSEAAFGANEFLDNLNKNAVYLFELERARTDPALMSRLAKDAEVGGLTPEAAADQYAVREALKIMGDFSRIAPWERKFLAVMPFYRWARHITQLTVRMPIEHPMRVAWTLRVADMFGEDQSDWPEWLKGSVTVGDWTLPTRFLNPFGDVAGTTGPLGVGGALADPDSFARSLSPFIKYPVATFGGVDLSSGLGEPLSMPTSERRLDPNSGRPTTTPLIDFSGKGVNFRGLANYAANQLPIARNIRDLALGDVPRYDTGQRIANLRPRQPFYQGPARLTQLVGLQEPIHMDDVNQMRRRLNPRARS